MKNIDNYSEKWYYTLEGVEEFFDAFVNIPKGRITNEQCNGNFCKYGF